jgi:hypothetical protein
MLPHGYPLPAKRSALSLITDNFTNDPLPAMTSFSESRNFLSNKSGLKLLEPLLMQLHPSRSFHPPASPFTSSMSFPTLLTDTLLNLSSSKDRLSNLGTSNPIEPKPKHESSSEESNSQLQGHRSKTERQMTNTPGLGDTIPKNSIVGST